MFKCGIAITLLLPLQVLTPKTARYVAKWIDGAKTFHNLSIDYVGLWNEHPPTAEYALLLRQALDSSEHGGAVEVVAPDWHTGHGNNTRAAATPGSSTSTSTGSITGGTRSSSIGSSNSSSSSSSSSGGGGGGGGRRAAILGDTLAPFMEALHTNASLQAAVARVGFHYPKRLANAAERLGCAQASPFAPLSRHVSHSASASERTLMAMLRLF